MGIVVAGAPHEPAFLSDHLTKQHYQASSPFREAIVGNFIKETRVSGVISNTNVLNAEPHIKHFDVGSQKIESLPQLLHAQSAPTPLPTPLQVNKLRVFLDGYPITSKNYLINGFLNGFSLDFDFVGPLVASNCVNLLSAIQNPDAVNDKLTKELIKLNLGRIAGPFPTRPLLSLRTSPLGLIP